jgi:hypothetical protein
VLIRDGLGQVPDDRESVVKEWSHDCSTDESLIEPGRPPPCIGTDDHEYSSLGVEESQHVPEVVVQQASPSASWTERIPERMTRTVASLRG